jgi:hypothetical protein
MSDPTTEARATYSTEHPHEPEIPPTLDVDGRCLVCHILLERDDALAALEQAERELEQARLRTPGRFCDACWTSSFSPCPEGTPNAIPDPDRSGQWIVCDHCQLHRELEQEREKGTALKELAGYVRSHLTGNNADSELRWALDLADEALASSSGDSAALVSPSPGQETE